MISMLTAAAIYTAPVPAMQYDWFSPVYDFPKKGLRPNELSITEAEITVNKRGYIENCTGHVLSGNPRMGSYICERLNQRDVFDPARDPQGQRLYGIFRQFVVLCDCETLPKDYRSTNFDIAVPSGSADQTKRFMIQFAVDTEGRASSCSLVRKVGFGIYQTKQKVDPAIVAQACRELTSKMRLGPARDRTGVAVPSVQNANVGVTAQ